jgi:outer membrane protein OmpA-like peptidoglycan-associated protein
VTSLALAVCASTTAIAATPVPLATVAGTPQAAATARDTDADGIPDRDDRCPGDAETPNGYQDEDGCPDLAPHPAPAASETGRIAERIGFLYDGADLRAASFPMLDAIAVVLKTQTQQFPLVALEGHAADNEHSPMRLSLARASAVRIALIGRGVEAGRLLARASGAMAPACTERNDTCRVRERSVELITLAVPKPTPPPEVTESEQAPPPEKKPERAEPPVPLARIEFRKGSAVMAPASLADLDLLAGFMKSNPVSLEIVGYADEAERKAATLAQARADAVRGYMMACGVSGTHVTTRAERTGRAACRSHSANCPARNGRAELRFVEAHAAAPPAGAEAPRPQPGDDTK